MSTACVRDANDRARSALVPLISALSVITRRDVIFCSIKLVGKIVHTELVPNCITTLSNKTNVLLARHRVACFATATI